MGSAAAVEWQYAPGQILVEDCLGSGCQSLLPPPCRQCGNAIQHLGTVDGGGVKQGSGLGGDPSEHYWVRLTPYQFGHDPAPNVPSFISRVCVPYAPGWGGLQRLLG